MNFFVTEIAAINRTVYIPSGPPRDFSERFLVLAIFASIPAAAAAAAAAEAAVMVAAINVDLVSAAAATTRQINSACSTSSAELTLLHHLRVFFSARVPAPLFRRMPPSRDAPSRELPRHRNTDRLIAVLRRGDAVRKQLLRVEQAREKNVKSVDHTCITHPLVGVAAESFVA